jgi:hypothetical protein
LKEWELAMGVAWLGGFFIVASVTVWGWVGRELKWARPSLRCGQLASLAAGAGVLFLVGIVLVRAGLEG